MTTYETTAGTTPDADEQHEARSIIRVEPEATYMMTEIGDGVFVQWGTCSTCSKRVAECTCKGGPTEAPYMEKWRTQRFAKSFDGRGVEPALPLMLKTRQRTVDAVLRLLRSKGWTIEPPAKKEPLPTTEEILEMGKASLREHHPTLAAELDEEQARKIVERAEQRLDEEEVERINKSLDELDGEPAEAEESKVDDAFDSALAAVRARAENGEVDAGF